MSGRVALALLMCACACSKSPNCRLGPGPPGFERFTCPDSSVLIPIPQGRVPGGEIHGTIRLFGMEQNSGIQVSLISGASPIGGLTDASGAYVLQNVIPGPYLLAMAYPAYLNDTIDRFLVLPEVTTLPLTTLFIGRNVFKAPTSNLLLSPTIDSFAIQGPGLTDIFDITRFQETDITTDTDRVQYSHDGKRLWVHEGKGDTRLIRWDVKTAVPRILGSMVEPNWQVASDDRSVAMMDSTNHCMVWDDDRSQQIVLGDNCLQFAVTTGNEVLALADGSGGQPVLVLWDITAHRGASLGPAFALPPPKGFRAHTFTYQTPGLQWLVVSDGDARVLPHEQPLDLSGDGHTLIVSGIPDRRVYLEDVKSGRRVLVANDGTGTFMPDGKTAALTSGDHTSLRLMDVLSGDQSTVSDGLVQTYFQPLGADNAVGLVLADADGGFDPAVWTPGLGLLTIAGHTAHPDGTFTRTPDGSAVVFESGGDLYLQELAAGAPGQRLSETALPPSTQLQISPDGQHVAFLQGCAQCALGDLIVYDRPTGARNAVASKVAKNLSFTPHGDLLYVHDFLPLAEMGDLAVYTPCDGPGCTGGIQRELLHRVGDRPLMASEKGTRALAWTIPTTGNRRGTLIDLHVPGAPVVTPVDDGVIESSPAPILTEKLLAYGNGSDDRPGLFVTAFPRTTPPFGAPLESP